MKRENMKGEWLESEGIRTDQSLQIRVGSLPDRLFGRMAVHRTQIWNARAGPFMSVSIEVLDGWDVVKDELRPDEVDDGFTRGKPGRRRPNWGVLEIEVNGNLADRSSLGYESYDIYRRSALGTDPPVSVREDYLHSGVVFPLSGMCT